ncbi:MAG TPA: type 3 dihydrofolate reductase [Leucothrix sp.]|nr:type 3 dihydrofolate reductase [Leucothrix sp.]
MRLSMIAALGKNRVIGNNNKMPWHLPADLQFFKKTTMGSPIIMGRKTYDSIGRPLPGRLNIVLSRNENLLIDGCTVVNSLEEAFVAVAPQNPDEIFITGGAYLYNKFIEDADRLYLTLIDEKFSGDTFFPDYTQYDWKQIEKNNHSADDENPHAYSFITLDRLR